MHSREKIQECVGILSTFAYVWFLRNGQPSIKVEITKAIFLLENRSFAVIAEEIALTGKYRDAACTDVVDQD